MTARIDTPPARDDAGNVRKPEEAVVATPVRRHPKDPNESGVLAKVFGYGALLLTVAMIAQCRCISS